MQTFLYHPAVFQLENRFCANSLGEFLGVAVHAMAFTSSEQNSNKWDRFGAHSRVRVESSMAKEPMTEAPALAIVRVAKPSVNDSSAELGHREFTTLDRLDSSDVALDSFGELGINLTKDGVLPRRGVRTEDSANFTPFHVTNVALKVSDVVSDPDGRHERIRLPLSGVERVVADAPQKIDMQIAAIPTRASGRPSIRQETEAAWVDIWDYDCQCHMTQENKLSVGGLVVKRADGNFAPRNKIILTSTEWEGGQVDSESRHDA